MCSVDLVGDLDLMQTQVTYILSNGHPHPVQMPCQIRAGFVPQKHALLLATAALTLVWSYTMEQEGLEWAAGVGWGTCWVSLGNPARVPGSFNPLPLP